MSQASINIAVAVSGGGRSLLNLLEQQKSKAYKIAAVVASRQDCGAVELARQYSIPIWFDKFPRNISSDKVKELQTWLESHGVDLVVLAGFLRPFPTLKAFEQKVLNIHPALLPSYGGQGMYGIKVHEAVCASGDIYSGATVHLVSEEYDKGRILAQIRVSIDKLRDPQAIADRVFKAECKLYPEVIHRFALGALPQNKDQELLIFEDDDI